MTFWKFTPFLAFSILVLYQLTVLQGMPIRPPPENPGESAEYPEEDPSPLLSELVKAYVQMKASEMKQQKENQGSKISTQKRYCNTATCLTHQLAGYLSAAGAGGRNNMLPTNMGFKVYNNRRQGKHR
ncbi:calcitonin gene-related peptide 1-like [Erinaceus europaeus]|uniref:Calcitonin gene-related peptide 1-like n=1 Tax=Erinaceus europaeus TaxID=9365 RepID=A0A1S3WW41_ERIEU|nr:calcitonin gene-related peptide 1-like [Erinaceus europaeus]